MRGRHPPSRPALKSTPRTLWRSTSSRSGRRRRQPRKAKSQSPSASTRTRRQKNVGPGRSANGSRRKRASPRAGPPSKIFSSLWLETQGLPSGGGRAHLLDGRAVELPLLGVVTVTATGTTVGTVIAILREDKAAGPATVHRLDVEVGVARPHTPLVTRTRTTGGAIGRKMMRLLKGEGSTTNAVGRECRIVFVMDVMRRLVPCIR